MTRESTPMAPAARRPMTRIARLTAATLLPLSLLTMVPLRADAADLELTIGTLASAKGNLRVAVYNSAAEYRKTAVQQLAVAASAGSMNLKFSNLSPGEYAVAVFHDVNGNEKLDANLLGMPTEPWGVSVLTRSLPGPPGWDDVKFTLPDAGKALTISLRE